MSLITIIIPYFNKSLTINRSVQSVLSQTYTNWELIIIDDGSTIPLNELFSIKDSRIFLLKNARNLGPGPTRQRGLDEARGEYVAFLDADDWWDKSFLYKALAALKHKNNAIAAWCQSKIFSTNGTDIRRYNLLNHSNLLRTLLKYGHSIQTSAFLWRKMYCGNWGDLSTNQDSYFEYSTCLNGTQIYPLDEVLLFRDETGDEHRSKYVNRDQQYINTFNLYSFVFNFHRNNLKISDRIVFWNRYLTSIYKVKINTDYYKTNKSIPGFNNVIKKNLIINIFVLRVILKILKNSPWKFYY